MNKHRGKNIPSGSTLAISYTSDVEDLVVGDL